MALSLGNPRGWTLNNVAHAQPHAPVPAPVPQAPACASSLAPAAQLEAREGPAAAQWQAVKEEIKALYEKRPLRDVKRILEQRHGFRATERMYKARLAQWGFSKNYSDKDYQVCAVMHHARQKGGKRSTGFVIHGHRRTLKDLYKYIKGRKMSEDEFLATAFTNLHCNSLADQHQDQAQFFHQYAHVRAYTPDPDGEGDEVPSAPSVSSAPSGPWAGHLKEIAASPAKSSPIAESILGSGTGSGSGSGEGGSVASTVPLYSPSNGPLYSPSSGPRYSPKAKLSPRNETSPAPFSPTLPHQQHTQFPPQENAALVSWPGDCLPPSHSRRASSALDGSYTLALSSTHAASNVSSGPLEDHLRHAGTVHDSTLAMPCQRLGKDVEYMALQIVDAPPLKSLCGHDDIRSWRLMSDTSSSPESEDYEHICPTCHELTRNHFISLPNLEAPQQPRSILNESSDVTEGTISIPASSRGHQHSWRWVARCFAACIYLSRGNDILSQLSLADAENEFEEMLVPRQDPKVLLALNQTLQILHMHDEGEITKTVMQSAYRVAERILGPDDPLTIIVRWMVSVADLQMRDSGITSSTLRDVHAQFVGRHGYDDPRSTASLYCYGYMLNVERQLRLAETVLREVYAVSSANLGPQHLQSISALTNLHRCLQRQNRPEEAIQVLLQAIHDSRETLGDNHPRRLESMRLLGLVYEELGHLDRAEEIYWVVLKGRIKMLGRNHRYTQGMKVDLEALLQRVGKWGSERPEPGGEAGKQECQDTDVESAAEFVESAAQLRIHDLFEWEDDEKWEDADETRSADGSEDTRSQHAAY